MPLEKLREEEIKGKENKYISVIEKNVDYLLGIINQLLDFQKLESSALQLNLKKCNVNALVSDIFNQFCGSAELRGLTLHLCLPHEEINMMIDSEKMSKILVNLIGNAMKYAKSRIELKVLSVDDEVRIEVTDDGPGIPEDQRDKIFQAFINCLMILWHHLRVLGLVWHLQGLWQKPIMGICFWKIIPRRGLHLCYLYHWEL